LLYFKGEKIKKRKTPRKKAQPKVGRLRFVLIKNRLSGEAIC